MTYNVASKAIPEDRSIIANKVGAAFASVRTAPVTADRSAPPPTVSAADSPDALPASSGRTETTPALLLGIANPLPRPTQAQAPKYIGKFTASWKQSRIPKTRPAHATNPPVSIIVVIP